MILTQKQTVALDLLENTEVSELVFGGGAGGGKSALGCYWVAKNCMKFPETRWLVGRSVLKRLRETTFVTMCKVLRMQGLVEGIHYRIHNSDFAIYFYNGSTIIFKDLPRVPNDPDYDYLGSLEITGAFVDEAIQIEAKCKEVLMSRIRHMLDSYLPDGTPTEGLEVAEYDQRGMPRKWYDLHGGIQGGLKPKAIFTCNPSRGWIYNQFYIPDKTNTIDAKRAFIQSLAIDNPYLPEVYIQTLLNLEESVKQRLLFGNWEYEDEDGQLFPYDKVQSTFKNAIPKNSKERYMTADIAFEGSDKFVIFVWEGLKPIDTISIEKSTPEEVVSKIKAISTKYRIKKQHVVYDGDGVGIYLTSYLKGAVSYRNNAPPKHKENYNNLSSQCFFKLSELIKDNQIDFTMVPEKYRNEITEELTSIRNHSLGTDNKLQTTPKKDIKAIIGRSPDFADALKMRMIFELKKKALPPVLW